MQAEKLADMTLDTVTHHRSAHLATGGNAQSRLTGAILLPNNQEGRTGKTGPASREFGKL